ncbi:MAG TPA: DUF2934 domain-containing protein [Sphingomonas sp.]|nr:DUF2934 domain-containing protein [Sphingomonas sp.]
MTERLVDVLGANGLVIHTYPVELDDAATEEDFRARALEAAAHGQLVPNTDLASLTTRMHISRGGRMEPVDDAISSMSETRRGLEQMVRERAYALWEEEGRPEGRADEHWHRALDQHLRERAYVSWEQQGRPDGGADGDWHRLKAFQSQ